MSNKKTNLNFDETEHFHLFPPSSPALKHREKKTSLRLHQSFEEIGDDEIEQRSFEAGEELENESIEKG